MTGIITLPLVPLRKSDSERSEMTSQLLFGELVEICQERECWLFVLNHADNYSGWVDRKMIKVLNADELSLLSSSKSFRVCTPLSACKKTTSNETMFLPGGSILSAVSENDCIVGDKDYKIDPSDIFASNNIDGQIIIRLAIQYLNAPYLWGGKSVFGIDCSGLVQVVYSIAEIQLSRDASQQVNEGQKVNSLSEAKTGDLAFFENTDGKIIHVGILLNSNQIIHASGWVKIENIDKTGIISAKTGEYTHRLMQIRRLIP